MKCPYCTSTESKVTNSREAESGTRRRRECQSCNERFTTYERIQVAGLVVLKEDDRREEFNKEKLIEGIRKACAKRPISPKVIEKLVEEIETELYGSGQWEVSSENIGEIDTLNNSGNVFALTSAVSSLAEKAVTKKVSASPDPVPNLGQSSGMKAPDEYGGMFKDSVIT